MPKKIKVSAGGEKHVVYKKKVLQVLVKERRVILW